MRDHNQDPIERKLNLVLQLILLVLNKETKIMQELDNLKAAVAQVLADVKSETDELSAAIAKVVAILGQPTINPADVQAAADALTAAHQGIVDAVAAAEAVLNPAPAPAAKA